MICWQLLEKAACLIHKGWWYDHELFHVAVRTLGFAGDPLVDGIRREDVKRVFVALSVGGQVHRDVGHGNKAAARHLGLVLL